MGLGLWPRSLSRQGNTSDVIPGNELHSNEGKQLRTICSELPGNHAKDRKVEVNIAPPSVSQPEPATIPSCPIGQATMIPR